MKHSDFSIGMEFYTGSGKWRCTDVGTRVITGICIDLPHEIVESRADETGVYHERRVMTDDPSWFHGPPYAVAEYVFDEYDMGGCYPTAEEVPGDVTPEQMERLRSTQRRRGALRQRRP
jgi:hypothetical protein